MKTVTSAHIALYKKVVENLDKMGQRVLELNRHPDSAVDQILLARDMYNRAYATWAQARDRLRERYTDRHLPWNKS